jgi:hypothetical protein
VRDRTLFRRNRGIPRRVVDSLEEREDIKTAVYEARGYKPREATFRKIANRF